jgi:hypothetical protein
VVDRPADVAAQPVVGAALDDQRRDDDQAPVAERQVVVRPGARRRVDRFLREPLAVALCEPGVDLVGSDAELARVGLAAALRTLVGRDGHVRNLPPGAGARRHLIFDQMGDGIGPASPRTRRGTCSTAGSRPR